MKHSSSNKLLLLFALSVFCVVCAIYVFMYKRVGDSISNNISAKEAVFLAEKNKDHEKEYLANFAKVESDMDLLPQYFVPTNKIVQFIEDIEAFKDVTGATTTISSLEADKLDSALPGTTGSLKARITAEGSWATAMRTIELVETLPYKISVSDLRLSSSEVEKTKKWQVSFNIVVGLIVPNPVTTSNVVSSSASFSPSDPSNVQ